MKVNVLFDDSGKIHAISHPIEGKKEGSAVLGRFIVHPGQSAATVEVPTELRHLKPRDLHDGVQLEHRDGSPRLVARKS